MIGKLKGIFKGGLNSRSEIDPGIAESFSQDGTLPDKFFENLAFTNNPIVKWDSADLEGFIYKMEYSKNIELLDENSLEVEDGKGFLDVLYNYKKRALFKKAFELARDRVIFEIVVLNIRKQDCAKAEKKFDMDFYRVLLKLMNYFEKDESFDFDSLDKNFMRDEVLSWSSKERLSAFYEEILEKYYDDMLKKEEEKDDKDKKKSKKDIKMPVKLILTDNLHTQAPKLLRKIFAPFSNKIKILKQEYGIFHAAILIGPLFIEWTNAAIVRPKKIQSQNALCAIDFDDVGMLKSGDPKKIADMIATHIHHWNTKMNYGSITIPGKRGNCQDFVTSLVKSLDIHFPKEIFHHFFASLKSGSSDLIFHPTKQLKKDFKLKNSYVFKTHGDLDNFAQNIIEKDVKADQKYKLDFMLLKSFDRAFWLRFIKIEEKFSKIKKSITKNVSKIDELVEKIAKRGKKKNDEFVEEATRDVKQLEDNNMILKSNIENLSMVLGKFREAKFGCPFENPIGLSFGRKSYLTQEST